MKTYLLDTLNKYKRISKGLDAKAILCNKSWQVFNNSGEKEIYIFQEDGSLIISLNGKAIIAKWSFISANDTVLISHNESSYMMKPFFNDDILFVLQLDGTKEYSFLIDESQKSAFPSKTLNELESHMKGIYELEERRKIETEQRKIAEARRKEEEQRKIAEARRKEEEQQLRQKIDREAEANRLKSQKINEDKIFRKLEKLANTIQRSKQYNNWKEKGKYPYTYLRVSCIILTMLSFCVYIAYCFNDNDEYLFLFLFLPIVPAVSLIFIPKKNKGKSFELKIKNKFGDYVSYSGDFDSFNSWCLENSFKDFTITNNNTKQNIAHYIQNGGYITINYLYNGEIVDKAEYSYNMADN